MFSNEEELFKSLREEAQKLTKYHSENLIEEEKIRKEFSKSTPTIESLKEEAFENGINIDEIVYECNFDVPCIREKLDKLLALNSNSIRSRKNKKR